MPAAASPSRPKWLAKRAQAEWKRIVPQLAALGLLTRVDRAALACYCEAVADLQDANEALATDGKVITSQSGYSMPHPAVAMKRQAMQTIRVFSAEFGLTPASRTRLSIEQPTPGAQELDDFLRGDKPPLRISEG